MSAADGRAGGEGAVGLRWGSAPARWVLLATVLGSSLVFLDGTSTNVALPAIAADLGAGVAGLQWVVTAYTLTLAALILLAGSLGDRWGRRRMFLIGTVWFTLASLLCGLAPSTATLVAARALQGVGGALLTPGSLAILQASFAPGERARAVGAWSGLSGVAAAAGPLIGGWLVDIGSWRWIFLTNIPLAVLVVAVTVRHVPESRARSGAAGLDVPGALLGTLGLGLVTWALIEAGAGGASPAAWMAGAAGLAGLAGFVMAQRRSPHPLVPPALFASRQFVGANLVTVAVYAVLSGLFFLLFLQLQQVLGYSAVRAGVASLPVTGLLLVLSSRAGALAERVGPRLPMTVGPLLLAAGLLLATRITADAGYITGVLPAVAVFGLGLAVTVAPLTATVLAAADPRVVGAASGANNAIARTAGLVAIAALPALAGLGGGVDDPAVLSAGFRVAMLICAAVAAGGGLIAWVTIRDRLPSGAPACPASALDRRHACPLDAPPLASRADADAVAAGAASP